RRDTLPENCLCDVVEADLGHDRDVFHTHCDLHLLAFPRPRGTTGGTVIKEDYTMCGWHAACPSDHARQRGAVWATRTPKWSTAWFWRAEKALDTVVDPR